MKVVLFKEDFNRVTEFYFNIILTALGNLGYSPSPYDKCTLYNVFRIPKKDKVLVTGLRTFLYLYLTGHRNLVYWYQGVTPEENFLLFKKKWKYYVYSYIEKLSLKVVKHKIGVSTYIFKHFEKKYKIELKKSELFVMPCFNSIFNEENFSVPGKYEKNIFCYAGSTRAWQGIDKFLSLYAEIEKKYENVFLKIYSNDIYLVNQLAKETGIKNYMIDCVSPDQIDDALSDCKFGFIIRDDDIINNVATPTKFATYLANGIIPIYSSSIHSYRDLSSKYRFLCCVDNDIAIDNIMPYMNNNVDKEEIKKEYKKIFNDFYNTDSYIMKLIEFLK